MLLIFSTNFRKETSFMLPFKLGNKWLKFTDCLQENLMIQNQNQLFLFETFLYFFYHLRPQWLSVPQAIKKQTNKLWCWTRDCSTFLNQLHAHCQQISPNMASQLEIELACTKHCWGVDVQNSIVNSVHVDDWTAKVVVIASNVLGKLVDI